MRKPRHYVAHIRCTSIDIVDKCEGVGVALDVDDHTVKYGRVAKVLLSADEAERWGASMIRYAGILRERSGGVTR